MAVRRGGVNSRRGVQRAQTTRRELSVPIYGYEDGSAVRAPEWSPNGDQRSGQSAPARRRKTRAQVRRRKNPRLLRNRARARRMGIGYITFLMAASVISVFLCVQFLSLKAEVTTQLREIALMDSKLAQMRTDNDAYYKKTLASVTIEDVREAATERLGMHYPSADQVRYYTTDENSYVRQYASIPDAEQVRD